MSFPALFLALLLGTFQRATTESLVQGKLRFAGSETMSPLLARWADAFSRRQPAALVQIEGRGSESAVRSLLAGTADVAALSRPLDSVEIAALRKRFGHFQIVAVGFDTLRLMARVGSGALSNPGAARAAFLHRGGPLQPVGRLPSSGTRHEAMEMLGIDSFPRGTLALVSPLAVQYALRSDPDRVGYGSPSVQLSDVRPVPGNAFVRPLSLVVPRRSLANPVVLRFLEYIGSSDARDIVRRSGFGLPPDLAR